MDAAELQRLGLYDPGQEHAELRLELLDYLCTLGATAEDLLEYHDSLPALATVLAVRGGAGQTLAETAESSGLSEEEIRRIVRAAGFPEPDPEARLFTESFGNLMGSVQAAVEVFGDDGLHQLLRVMGAAMARLADAVVSAFSVQVEPAARREDPVGLAVARANGEAAELLPLVPAALDVLFRQHLLLSQRTASTEVDLVGYETQLRVVGFVDMVGSAELAENRSLSELGAVLRAFEDTALDAVTRAGGRIIKLIGDEVLFTAPDAASACRAALDLADACERHELLPEVRVGLASGRVMLRDGDVFGPVVNLAARAVKAAAPGQVLATSEVVEAAGVSAVPLGVRQFKGIAAETQLAALVR